MAQTIPPSWSALGRVARLLAGEPVVPPRRDIAEAIVWLAQLGGVTAGRLGQMLDQQRKVAQGPRARHPCKRRHRDPLE